ncbi:glycosyltransferase family 39 protein [PVC group bacterium]|nr:glycosyltransferase family 39 protein [PVC group bacterium]
MKRILPNWHDKHFFFVLTLIAAFLPRFFFLTETINTIEFNTLLKGNDQIKFHRNAVTIVKTNDWKMATHAYNQAPLYTYFLAAVYKIISPDIRAARLIQTLLGIMTSIFIYLIGLRFFRASVSFLSAFLYGMYNYAIYFESVLLRATLIGFWNILIFYLLIRYFETRSVPFLILSGIVLGLNIMTRPNALILVPFLIWSLIYFLNVQNEKSAKFFFPLFALSASILLPILPFIARNISLGFSPLAFSAQGATVFISGNTPDALGWGWEISRQAHALLQQFGDNPIALGKHLLILIYQHPLDWIALQAQKLYRFFNEYEIPNNVNFYLMATFSNALKMVLVDFRVIAILAIPGLFLSFKRTPHHRLFVCFFLGLFFSIFIFYILGRFRLPVVGLLCLSAGFTLERILTYSLNRKWLKLGTLGAILILLSFFTRMPEEPVIRSNHFFNMGLIYLKTTYFPQAEIFFRKALEKKPKYDRAAIQLADIYTRTGHLDEAEKIILEQILQSPGNHKLAVALGDIFIKRGKIDLAYEVFQGFEALDPKSPYPYYYYGVIEKRAGNHKKALQWFKKSYQINPNLPGLATQIEKISSDQK